jgi:pimeloyl-ACP methyl ester carboxylesterase
MTPMIKDVPPQMQQAEEIAGGADAMGRFIVDELLPWADGRYPTLPTRLLVGHSFGGLFVLYTAAMRPGVFRVVIAASPSLYADGGAIGADIAARLAADSVHGRSIFVTSGDFEGGLDQSVTQFATTLTSLVHDSMASHLAFRRQRYEATDHSMTPLPTVVDGLRWAYAPMRVPADSVFAGLSAGPPKDTGQILAAWHGLESRFHSSAASLGVPDATFPEYATNLLAYYCTLAKQPELANRFFRENVRRYPTSSNAEESLGEGLLAVNDTAGAVAAFGRTLVLSTRDDDVNAILSHVFLRHLVKQGARVGSGGR